MANEQLSLFLIVLGGLRGMPNALRSLQRMREIVGDFHGWFGLQSMCKLPRGIFKPFVQKLVASVRRLNDGQPELLFRVLRCLAPSGY